MAYKTRRRARVLQPPLPPKVLAAQSKEMKLRLSTSSLVLGAAGPETRDWSLSSTQPRPVGLDAYNPAQRKTNLAVKKALQTVQVVLGEDNPEWGSSNAMPAPTGELSRYRGALSKETARFIKTSSVKMGSLHPGSQYKTSMARDGLPTPDHEASVEIFKSNREIHDKQRSARSTGIFSDGMENTYYESSNAMPDLTDRLRKAHSATNQKVVRGVRRSNILLGDARIKTLTTTQHDSMDEIVEATSKMEPGFNARTRQDPRYSTIKLGDGAAFQWTTSNTMPNWYAPETYDTNSSTEDEG